MLLLLGSIVFSSDIFFLWNQQYNNGIGLIIRPIFIILYSDIGKKAMIKFFRIFYLCIRYLVLMWILLFIFSCLGQYLYGNLSLSYN
jgi:hypothetical protein